MKDLEKLKTHLNRLKIFYKEKEKLANHTTVRIGGFCDLILFPDQDLHLIKILKILEEDGYPYYVLGGGSNLLVSDEGFRGVIVCFKSYKGIEKIGEKEKKIVFRVKAGTNVNELISLGLKEGFEGLEFLAGVPATVGGAVRMNAGAFGKSVSEFVKKIKLYNKGELEEIQVKEDWWEYRRFKKEGIILEVEMEFYKNDKEKIREKTLEFLSKRKKTQPLEKRTFGSVFKNPPCYYAGQLIDLCGLKGYRIGDAEVSKKHANFIVNLGKASAEDVLKVMKLCRNKVYEKFKILLEPEVKFLGFKDEEIDEFN